MAIVRAVVARRVVATAGLVLALVTVPAAAWARVLHVPRQHATIQDAVNAAAAGDEIRVAPGSYCGAVIDRPVALVGDGRAVIVGCDAGPIVFGSLHAGFFLPGSAGSSAASGTHISGFVFDGRGVSNDDLAPLAMAVFGRFAHDVRVTNNLFLGTVQAITNTAGDRWLIAHNRIRDLTLFDCTGAFCSGGAGITIQVASASAVGGPGNPVDRPEGNVVLANDIEGTIPDGFGVFSMIGIFVLAADGTTVIRNRVAIPDNPDADATGEGILVDDTCCGNPTPVEPGARNTALLFNDGRQSQFAVVVDGTGGENTEGLVLFGNLGVEVIEGVTTRGPGPRRPHHRDHMARHQRIF